MNYVVVQDVIKIYKARAGEVVALRGVDLSVPQGELVVISGPSGSGKTTLLNVIGGLDRPSAGKVFVNAMSILDLTDLEMADFRLRTIGFIFQSFNLVSFLTVRQNVVLPMYLSGASGTECRRRANELMNVVGLERRADYYPRTLSGGEQQRAAVAAALCNNPPLILADEPTAELDTESGRAILELLSKLCREDGRTVLVVTHDERIREIGDRSFRMTDGRILAET